jgi:enoyl-CoA hydratase/carnithine racemase
MAPFLHMGLIPDCGLTESLPRVAGYDAALEICLTGRLIHAHEAQALGILTRVYEHPLQQAIELGITIAERPRAAARTTALLRQRAGHHAEATEQADLLANPDFTTHLARWRHQSRARAHAQSVSA